MPGRKAVGEAVEKRIVRQQIEAAHADYSRGILENDPVQVLEFYRKWTSPDFEERDNPVGNVTTREAMLSLMEQVVALKTMGNGRVPLEAATDIEAFEVGGGAVAQETRAIAVMSHRYVSREADSQGWFGPKDQEHEITVTSRWRETWVQTDAGWRLQTNAMLGSQTFVDGVFFNVKLNERG